MGPLRRLWWGLLDAISVLFTRYKFARRVMLFWAMWLITVVVLRTTDPEIITALGGAAAVGIVGPVVGILATVLGFYAKSRERDDRRGE